MRIQYVVDEDDDDPSWLVTLDPGEKEAVAKASGVTAVTIHDRYWFSTVYGRDNPRIMWWPQAHVFGLLRHHDGEGRLDALVGETTSEEVTVAITP